MIHKLIGVALIISAFVVEGMWLGVCFGTVLVGIAMLIFAPGLLLLPFNFLFTLGVGFLTFQKLSDTSSYGSYRSSDYSNYYRQQNSYRYHQEYETPSSYTDHSMQKYYDVLGCSMDDDFETIRQAYRKLSKEYHPDTVEGKGMGKDFVEYATRKMQEINEAYRAIKKERGL